MITYSGRSVWPEWSSVPGVPRNISPSLEDIAVGLGRQSRFAGQTREFYTVLCHSLACAQAAQKFVPADRNLRRHLLTHDGHEAMISDVPTTWKNDLTRIDEADLDRRIMLELGLEPLDDVTAMTLKHIDNQALAAEAHALGHVEAEVWWPRADFDEITEFLYETTIMKLKVGDPWRYLRPEEAIEAMRRAFNV